MVISASFALAPSCPLAKKLRARTAGFLGCIPHSSVRRAEESIRGCRETWKVGKEDEESSSGRVGTGAGTCEQSSSSRGGVGQQSRMGRGRAGKQQWEG